MRNLHDSRVLFYLPDIIFHAVLIDTAPVSDTSTSATTKVAIADAIAEKLICRHGGASSQGGNISCLDHGQTLDIAAKKAGLGSGSLPQIRRLHFSVHLSRPLDQFAAESLLANVLGHSQPRNTLAFPK